jgi:hypothetical protein
LRLSGLTPGRAVRKRIWMVLMPADTKVVEATTSRYQNDPRINHLQTNELAYNHLRHQDALFRKVVNRLNEILKSFPLEVAILSQRSLVK